MEDICEVNGEVCQSDGFFDHLLSARESFIVQNHMPHFHDDDAGRMGFAAGYNDIMHKVAFNIDVELMVVGESDHPFRKAFIRGRDLAMKEFEALKEG